MTLRQNRFRALIVLDSPGPRSLSPTLPSSLPVRGYLNHTHALMIRIPRLRAPGGIRYFPAEICWDDERQLHPGDHAEVTITVTDDEALDFLGAGQRFILWSGGEVGHGTISRKIFTQHGPS